MTSKYIVENAEGKVCGIFSTLELAKAMAKNMVEGVYSISLLGVEVYQIWN